MPDAVCLVIIEVPDENNVEEMDAAQINLTVTHFADVSLSMAVLHKPFPCTLDIQYVAFDPCLDKALFSANISQQEHSSQSLQHLNINCQRRLAVL